MSLDQLHPYADQHAIQSAVFSVHFSTELDVRELGQLKAAAADLKADFPNIVDNHMTRLSFQVTPGAQSSPVASASEHGVGGYVMQRLSAGGIPVAPMRQIVVAGDSVVIVINDYTRWAKFKTDVERYLSVLLKPINSQKGISSVGLQFSDVFVWRADPADLDMAEVFSTNTQYLVPNVFNGDLPLWHSHHGYLMERTEPFAFQQLDNINVSRNLVSGAQQLQIVIVHKATFARPLYKVLDANKEKVSQIMATLHSRNKEILADLLSEGVQAKINLNTSKD